MTAHQEAPFSHSLPCASHLLATTFAGWLYFSEPIPAPRTDAHPDRLHTQRIWGNGSHHVPKCQSGADSVWEQLNGCKQSMSSGMFWHEGESGSSVQVLRACVMEEGVKVFLLCL